MRTIPALVLFSVSLAASAQPALTIYNQNFAVVRDTVPLNLKAGVNNVNYSEATAHVEPDTVILRNPTGQHNIQILEQNYRNDPVSQDLLLSLCEGRTIGFEVMSPTTGDVEKIVQGKIVRSGYVPPFSAMNQYGDDDQQAQMNPAQSSEPIIEVDGEMQFGLPGKPLFPDLGNDTILKPALNWVIQSDSAGKFDAEIGYLSEGFSWQADYNLVSPEKGDDVDLVGWVTLNNQSGKTFENAKIKLMAGDVNRVQPPRPMMMAAQGFDFGGGQAQPPVSEKAFDEYHLYTLENPTTLRDGEMKQVEFVHAEGIRSKTIYVYDGADQSQISVMREFSNSKTNHLGMALPKGKLRFYRRDDDGQLEFVGEDEIDHTPADETIRVNTGNAFDLVGERRQTNYNVDSSHNQADESFEIKLRNHKKEPVEIRVVEHLYRWNNWEITAHSADFTKKDAQTIEFNVQVQPAVEKTVTYTAHYSW